MYFIKLSTLCSLFLFTSYLGKITKAWSMKDDFILLKITLQPIRVYLALLGHTGPCWGLLGLLNFLSFPIIHIYWCTLMKIPTHIKQLCKLLDLLFNVKNVFNAYISNSYICDKQTWNFLSSHSLSFLNAFLFFRKNMKLIYFIWLISYMIKTTKHKDCSKLFFDKLKSTVLEVN